MRALVFIFAVGLVWPAQAKLKVITTTTSLASLVQEVGQEHIAVTSLTKSTQDPHFVEAKPSYMVKLRNADLLVAVGLDLEIGWLSNVQRGAKNPKLLDPQKGFFEAGHHIKALDIPTGKVDRSKGDIHPQGNPHFHLDPSKALQVAEALAVRLSQLDPGNKGAYSKNFQDFSKRLNIKTDLWKARVAKTEIKKVITYHKSFNYFLSYFGIAPVANIEPKPGIPPTAKHIISLMKLIKTQNVKCILNESYFETTAAKRLQRDTGAHLEVLNIESSGDYIQLIENIVTAIESCAKGGH